MGLKTSKF